MTEKPNYLAHEALDRTCMLMEIIEQQLLDHQYIKDDLMLTENIQHVCTTLMHVYQAIGRDHL